MNPICPILKIRSYKAFSLGEVLLAGFVLTVGLLATSALMAKSLKHSFENRDAIIATLLAQEGVELVRNVRDNDFAANGTGFPEPSFDSNNKHCRIDYNDSITSLDCHGSFSSSRYKLNFVNKFYQHDGVDSGKFSRYIHVDYDNSAKEATIISFVYWDSNNIPDNIEDGETASCNIAKKCVYTEDFLTSWYTP